MVKEHIFPYLNYIPTEIILIGIFTVLLWWYSSKKHSYWKDRNIPYVKPLPIFGSLIDILTTPVYELELKRYFSLGPVYGAFEGTNPVLVVGDPQLIRDILIKDFPIFQNRRLFQKGVKVIDLSLLGKEGEEWKKIRAAISPAFTTKKLKRLLGIFKDCSKTVVQNFKISAQKKEPTSVTRFIDAFLLDMTASSAFSTKIDSFNDPKNEFVLYANKTFGVMHRVKMFIMTLFASWNLPEKYFNSSIFDSSTMEFFSNAIKEIISERKRTKQTRDDFLQLLLDVQEETANNNKKDCVENDDDIDANYGQDISGQNIFTDVSKKILTHDELVAQCVVFFLAAHGTTSSLLTFAMYQLAINESIQEKVYQEITQHLQETNGELTYEALQKMIYLDNIISETLRLYPPPPRISRRAEKEYKLGETEIAIQKDMVILVPVLAIHRDPKYYPDPEKFDPNRFSAEEVAKRHPNVYFPFGDGPRTCIGKRFAQLSAKVFLVYVLSCFNIKPCSQTKIPLEFKRSSWLALHAKDVTVKLEIRNDSPLVHT